MPGGSAEPMTAGYFNAVETLLKTVTKFEPSVFTATIMATEMPAAIKPYSIAVAAD
jgi:hypothetical protein